MAAPTLKFKRGAYADLPTLAVGEPGFTTDKYQLYVGSPAGNQLIGGGNFWNLEETTSGGGIKLFEGTNNGTSFVELQSPASLAGIQTFIVPGTDGSANQVLKTDGSGNLSFADVAVSAIDIDGATDIGAAITDSDVFIVDDGGGGTNRKTAASRIKAYVLGGGGGGSTFDSVIVGSAVTINSSGIVAAGLAITAGTFVGDLTGNVTGNADTATSATSADTVKTISNDTDAAQFLTFVADNNGSATAEAVRTDAGITYNPSSNLLDVAGNLTVGGTVDGRDVLDDGQAGDNLVTLSGVARDATDLGTFTGTTIADNETIKGALQDLETELETIGGGGASAATVATAATVTNASHFITFVDANNASKTQEAVHTDAGISYNPATNTMAITGGLNVTGVATAAGFVGPLTGNVTGNVNGNVTTTSLTVTGTAVTAILDEDNMASNRADALATQQSIKAYVDSEITGVAVTFAVEGDSGAGIVTTGTTLSIDGTSNEVETSVSGNTVTIGLPNTVNITTELNVPTVDVGALRASDGTAAMTIADSTGKVTSTTDVEVQGTFTATSAAVFQGNTDIGNQTSDTLTLTARLDSDVVPSTNDTRDLGATSLAFNEGYINRITGVSANLSGVATAGEYKGATLTLTGNGTFGGNVQIDGNLSIGGSVTNIDVEDLRIVSPVVELGLQRLADGSLQPPAGVTTKNSGVVMYYNHVGINSTNAKIAAMFAKIANGQDMRIGFATDVTITTVGAGDSVASVSAWADIEAKGLWINDCAGVSQVISCSGSTRNLENITIDGGAFT